MAITHDAIAAAFAPLQGAPAAGWDQPIVYIRGGLYAAQDVNGALTWSGPWRQRDVGDARRAMAALATAPEIPRFILAHRFAVERMPEFIDWTEHQLLISWDGQALHRWHLTADCHFDSAQVLVAGAPRVRGHRPVRREADMATTDDFFADAA